MRNLMVFAVRAGTLSLALVAAAAFGQSDADALSAVRACGSIEDDAARLACLDAALGTDTGRGEIAEIGVEADEETTSTEIEPVAPGVDNDRADAVVEERSIRVVDMRRNDFGVTTFLTEDGETWVQRSGTRGRFPPVPFDAILQPGMGDTYFLQSPLGGPRARVEELR